MEYFLKYFTNNKKIIFLIFTILGFSINYRYSVHFFLIAYSSFSLRGEKNAQVLKDTVVYSEQFLAQPKDVTDLPYCQRDDQFIKFQDVNPGGSGFKHKQSDFFSACTIAIKLNRQFS